MLAARRARRPRNRVTACATWPADPRAPSPRRHAVDGACLVHARPGSGLLRLPDRRAAIQLRDRLRSEAVWRSL